MVMGWQETLAWGILGGIGTEAVVFFALRYRPPVELPAWMKSWRYYVIAAVMALLGGAVAVANSRSGNTLNPMMALQIGPPHR